ncbi:O-antigen polymerase [Spirosoma sp. KNUC1025]|uniref:O-antigen polymerase n=1 Tax=Spirosoma sp. KNUC1025 TaxID=2894082 RepID=UPI003865FDCC|nr:oligosaccharide repeat unit polymerase [Spirosoma sp. KNUC1025]
MEIENGILPEVLAWIAIILAIYLTLYYKFLYSIIDPLFNWIISTAFASYFATLVIPDVQDIYHFFGCQIALWFGFVIAYCKNNIPSIKAEPAHNFSDQLLLRYTTYFLLSIYILSNIIIGYSKGFALFSDNPTLSKVEDFQGGFGLFRKINWAAGKFTSSALIYMYLIGGRRKDLIYFIIVAIFSAVDGSKSALFGVITTIGVILYHPSFLYKKDLLTKTKRYIPIFLVGALSISFVVLTKEKGSLNDAYLGFITRLLYSADSLLYFYQPVNIDFFEKYSYVDYISVITNPILGFLRLQPYQEAVGNIMYDNLRTIDTGSEITVGPNAPFYIEGRIYFYYWGAFPFSMLIGYLYAKIRVYYLSIKNASAFYFVYVSCFFQFATTLIGDVSLAVSLLFSLAFFVIPPYILIRLILYRKFTIRLKTNLIISFKI